MKTTKDKFLTISNAGFTLIELLITIAVIGIIAGIFVPRFTGASEAAKDKAAKVNLELVANAFKTVALRYDNKMMQYSGIILTETALLNSKNAVENYHPDKTNTSVPGTNPAEKRQRQLKLYLMHKSFVEVAELCKDSDILLPDEHYTDGYEYVMLHANPPNGSSASAHHTTEIDENCYVIVRKKKNNNYDSRWGNYNSFINGGDCEEGTVIFLGTYKAPH